MTFRDLLFEMLDCGIDDLDAQVIVFNEENEKGNYVAVQDDFIDVSKMVMLYKYLYIQDHLQMFKRW